MGSGISVKLECERLRRDSKVLEGTLIFVNKKKKKRLHRAARVTLQCRVTLVNGVIGPTGDRQETETVEEIYKVGGDVAPRGTELSQGETRFPFSFPELESALMTDLPKPQYYAKRYGRFAYCKYDIILRAGSPPQTKDLQSYPESIQPYSNERFHSNGTVASPNNLGVDPSTVVGLIGAVAI